jgi:hypothetical protein
MKPSYVKLLTAFLCTNLLGCFSSTLSPTTVAPREVERLRMLAEKRLPLSLKLTPPPDTAVGYQYILLMFPVARVYAPALRQDVVDGLTATAAAAGHSIETLSDSRVTSPRLEVTASNITVNGYDLIFVRRPSASITLKGTLSSPGRVDRTCEAVGSVTRTKRFAFAPELEQVVRESIEAATRELAACLFPEARKLEETSEDDLESSR